MLRGLRGARDLDAALLSGGAGPLGRHMGRQRGARALGVPHWKHRDQVAKIIKGGGTNPYMAGVKKRTELFKK